jgi:hypothetical protein
MKHSTRRSARRALIPLLALLLTAGIVGLTPIAAQASSTSAQLQIKGPGSVYTPGEQGNHQVTLAGSPGSAISFAAKVVNTGTTTAQFKLYAGDCCGATVTYTVAGVVANGLINSADGYYTPAIAPGKSIAITIKDTLNKTNPPDFDYFGIDVYDSDGQNYIDSGTFAVMAKAPSAATGPNQMFVKNGSSSYVGGPVNGQVSTSPSLAVGGSTTFTVHLVNGDTASDVLYFSMSDQCTNYLIDVKAGSVDKTDAVLGGTYQTPLLAPGGHQDLTVKVTYLGSRGGCDYDYIYPYAFAQNSGVQSFQNLVVNPAA